MWGNDITAWDSKVKVGQDYSVLGLAKKRVHPFLEYLITTPKLLLCIIAYTSYKNLYGSSGIYIFVRHFSEKISNNQQKYK